MAMAGSPTPTVKLSLSGPEKYFALIIILVGITLLGYINKMFPLDQLYAGLGSGIVVAFAFISHDLEDAHSPKGVPSWATFLVITFTSAAWGGIAYFSASPIMETSAIVTWLIVVLGYIFHILSEDKGVDFPANAEVWMTSILGVILAALVWYQSNPTAGVSALITVLVLVVPQYLHVNFHTGTVTPVVDPPNPIHLTYPVASDPPVIHISVP